MTKDRPKNRRVYISGELAGYLTSYGPYWTHFSELKDGAGTVLAKYCYTAGGRVSSIRTMNGLSTDYRYDSDGNLSGILLKNQNSGDIIYSASLYYDLCGNRIGRSGHRLGADGKQYQMETVFRYDAMANINGIIYYANIWTNQNGMLQGVLTQKEIVLVKKWISIISYCVI